ncbi:MAG: hypothetical protein ACLQIB_13215 [Isosphaeraceae bacterium]
MGPNEFLDTAERLAQGGTEGDCRSAISRAYYSVFHRFRNFFLAQGLDDAPLSRRCAPLHHVWVYWHQGRFVLHATTCPSSPAAGR